VLHRIEGETGEGFAPRLTGGEASDIIAKRFAENAEAKRAHRRARQARRRAANRAAGGR
jgi:hypothetical protein